LFVVTVSYGFSVRLVQDPATIKRASANPIDTKDVFLLIIVNTFIFRLKTL